ncbi:DUF7347 domain-containing protein [Halostella pelagica]|uniref:DUF7347 domain-containing protein n=1 Tax=Halostella pelagica TaxID=2583824 RepID=UPI0010820DDA|nr:helix-turn-helix transcriptional regulator [Halostella pelagica]
MSDDRVPPTDAFETLGNETRLAIVQTVTEKRRTNWIPARMTFSEVQAGGIGDAGKSNYHLGVLFGRSGRETHYSAGVRPSGVDPGLPGYCNRSVVSTSGCRA